MADARLSGAEAVTVQGVTIDAPGLEGDVVVESGAGVPRRDAADQVPDPIRRAIGRHRGRARRTIRIEAPSDAGASSGATTRGATGRGDTSGRRVTQRPPSMRVAVPAPRPGRGQVLLSRDEHGIVTWHFPVETTRDDALADGRQVFDVPRAPSGPPTRGFGLPKILQVVSFPLTLAAGKAVAFEVRSWDRERHPYALRMYGRDRSLTAIDDAGWQHLASGRSLLIIHGTFDTVTGCLSRLPDATLNELHERYGGRVIAFDHATLGESPIDNARAFFKLVGDHTLDVDIVCHSRGGLVTRAIAERPGDLKNVGSNVRVGTGVLVGATTNGTWLADLGHWNDMIDRLTTLLSLAPVPMAVDALETIFGLVRSLAVSADHDLAGLDAMAPTRPYLAEVNSHPSLGPGGSYRAIASNYEPADPALSAFFSDALKDQVIFNGPNDGMVGVDEILGEGITAPFPVTLTCMLDAADGVEHAAYFGHPKTSAALHAWLTG